MGRTETYKTAEELQKAVGRPKKYKTAEELQKAVDGYFTSISYQEEVHGLKVTRWVKAPTMAGLYLYLQISKETWSKYGKKNGLKEVVEGARLVAEDYWAQHLTGKGAQGAKFALSACYGWREKVDVTGDGLVKVTLGEEAKRLAE